MDFTDKLDILYARRSSEDGKDGESIENQVALLKQYAADKGYYNIKVVTDDGYTGTNFNRPGFQEAFALIQHRRVGRFIVKDLSRLGRNTIEVGQYIGVIFPRFGVEFISVHDGPESSDPDSLVTQFKNIMNEYYAKDISDKQKLSLQARSNSGRHIASTPTYGYKLDPNDRHHWIIDEPAAEVVRLVFKYYNEGMQVSEIARTLEKAKYPAPSHYRKRVVKGSRTEKNPYHWTGSSVTAILKRQDYVGDTVNFRTQSASYKNKTVIYNESDKIRIFPDTHPAIISHELFQMAQDRREKTIRHPSRPHKYLFGDYLYCMDCHARMHGRRCGTKSENALYCYECTTYRKSKGCYFHGVPEKYLETEVLQAIQSVIYKANANPDEFYKTIQKRVEKKSDDCKAVILAELEKSQLRITEIDKYIQGLFEAKVRGEIDGSLFASLKRTYDEEKEQLNVLVAELIGKLHEKNESVNKVKLFMQAIKTYDAVTELTPQVLADFIEHIEVGKCQNTSKKLPFSKRDNAVSVFFWGIGIF